MALEADWESLSHDVVTVEPCVGLSAYGAPTYGTPWTEKAIVQCNRKLVTFSDGRVEVSTTQLFVLSATRHIGMQDRLSWTTMSPPSTEPPRILTVDHAEDEDGQHHIEVALG